MQDGRTVNKKLDCLFSYIYSNHAHMFPFYSTLIVKEATDSVCWACGNGNAASQISIAELFLLQDQQVNWEAAESKVVSIEKKCSDFSASHSDLEFSTLHLSFPLNQKNTRWMTRINMQDFSTSQLENATSVPHAQFPSGSQTWLHTGLTWMNLELLTLQPHPQRWLWCNNHSYNLALSYIIRNTRNMRLERLY